MPEPKKPRQAKPKKAYDFDTKCSLCDNDLTAEEQWVALEVLSRQPALCFSCRIWASRNQE